MKHLCAFLLLTVFLYNLVGVYPVAMWQQYQLRHAAEKRRRAALPDAGLVRITVARNQLGKELKWQEQHEFAYRGQLYDVVRQHGTADSVTYLCWHDHNEEKLLAGLTKHVREYAHPEAGARKSAKKVFDYLSKISFLAPAPTFAGGPVTEASRPHYPPYAAQLCFLPQAAPFAPPRLPAAGSAASQRA